MEIWKCEFEVKFEFEVTCAKDDDETCYEETKSDILFDIEKNFEKYFKMTFVGDDNDDEDEGCGMSQHEIDRRDNPRTARGVLNWW